MDTVICKETIVATITRRGKGVKHSPIRIITQVFEKDGTMIAEYDPSPETFIAFDLIHFTRWCNSEGLDPEKLTLNDVDKWLDSIEHKSSPGLHEYG